MFLGNNNIDIKHILKQGGGTTVITYVGVFLGACNAMFLFPYFLSLRELGVRSLLIDAATILYLFPLLGINSIFLKFFPLFTDKKKRGEFYFSFIMIFFICFLLSIISFSFMDKWILQIYVQKSPLFSSLLFLLPYLVFFMGINMILSSIFRCEKNIITIALVKEIQIRIFTLIIVLLYAYDIISAEYFWYLFVAIYGLNSMVLFFVAYKRKYFTFRWSEKLKNISYTIDLFKYGLFNVVFSTFNIIIEKADILMIGFFMSETDVGIYALSIFIISFIEIPKISIAQVLRPILSEAVMNNEIKRIKEIYHQMSINAQLISSYLLILIWQNIDFLYKIIPKGEMFYLGKNILLIIGIAKVFDMMYSFNSELIAFSKEYKINLYINLVSMMIGLILNWLLIPVYGLNGAALATAIVLLFINVIRFFYIKSIMKLTPLSVKNLLVFIFFILLLGITSVSKLYLEVNLLNSILGSIILSVLFLGFIYKYNISEKSNLIISLIIKKIQSF